MKSFYSYAIEEDFLSEGGRSRGEDMEHVIVNAVNGNPEGVGDIPAEAGTRVADFLKKKGIKGRAKVLGADTIDVSSTWKEYFGGTVPGATRTPKTDFMIGKNKISLKTGDGAQLMSGAKKESLATFYTALEEADGVHEDVVKKLTSMFEGLAPSSVAATDLRTAIKDQSDEMVKKADAAHKEMMNELGKIFNSNQAFRDAFAHEAMSGEVKFGGNLGACEYFLVSDFDGSRNKLKSVDDKSYVSKVASQMKLSVRFKTSSVKKKVDGKSVKTGEYRYFSAVGLNVHKMHEEAEIMMNGGLLTEANIKDWIGQQWKRLKNIFKKALAYIKKSLKNALDFLQVEPVIRVKTKVRY